MLIPKFGSPNCVLTLGMKVLGGEIFPLSGIFSVCGRGTWWNLWWNFDDFSKRGKQKETKFCRPFAANFAAWTKKVPHGKKLWDQLRGQTFAGKLRQKIPPVLRFLQINKLVGCAIKEKRAATWVNLTKLEEKNIKFHSNFILLEFIMSRRKHLSRFYVRNKDYNQTRHALQRWTSAPSAQVRSMFTAAISSKGD